jgi:hypothetical protein
MRGTLPGQVEQQARQAVRSGHAGGGLGRDGTFTVEGTERMTWRIRGEPVIVQKRTLADEWSGGRYREYFAEIPDQGHITMIMLTTPDESGVTIELGPPPPSPSPMTPPAAPREKHATTALSEAEVQRFFESFQ